MVAICGTLVCLLIFVAAYISSNHGWWWTVFGMGVVYYSIYRLVDA